MSLLTDSDLERLIVQNGKNAQAHSLLIDPYEPKSLTPVGYDLRVGTPYATSNRRGRSSLKNGESLTIRPGATALITTLEKIEMPRDCLTSGFIESKVSKVSKGLSHISTTVDPDWRGNLLVAIHNHSNEPISLAYGEAFCTLVLIRNESASTRKCEKEPGRADIFLQMFDEENERGRRRQALKLYIPPVIILGSTALGWFLFGNAPGFPATGVAGVAIASYVSEKFS